MPDVDEPKTMGEWISLQLKVQAQAFAQREVAASALWTLSMDEACSEGFVCRANEKTGLVELQQCPPGMRSFWLHSCARVSGPHARRGCAGGAERFCTAPRDSGRRDGAYAAARGGSV